MLTFWQILILMVVAFVLVVISMAFYYSIKYGLNSMLVEDGMKAYGELLDKQFEKQKQNLNDLFKE